MTSVRESQGNGGRRPSMPDSDDHPCIMRGRVDGVEEAFGRAMGAIADMQSQLGRLDVDREKSTGLVGMLVRMQNQLSIITYDNQRGQFEGETTKVQSRSELYDRLMQAERKISMAPRSIPPKLGLTLHLDGPTVAKAVLIVLGIVATGMGLGKYLP